MKLAELCHLNPSLLPVVESCISDYIVYNRTSVYCISGYKKKSDVYDRNGYFTQNLYVTSRKPKGHNYRVVVILGLNLMDSSADHSVSPFLSVGHYPTLDCPRTVVKSADPSEATGQVI